MFAAGGDAPRQRSAERDHRPPHRDQEAESAPRHFRLAGAAADAPYAHPHPHSPPVRDAASLKGVKYGAGHDKYPSWPTSAAADAPAARPPATGGSHRSKSWTDRTHYPKETVVLYTRAYMKRPHRQQQLKPVFETAMGAPQPERYQRDYALASPPERDPPVRDLADYSTAYEVKMVMRQEVTHYSAEGGKQLTQSELEQYTRSYETLGPQHQKQPSYAQSEGYHSYVSSSDSTSTPLIDRLRREADASVSRSDSGLSGAAGGAGWGEAARGDRDSVVTTSSGSGSSSETLKWHGSLSDISVASSSQSCTSKQLIAHSAKVQTPQRHGSESVLYIARDGDIEHRAVPPGNCQQHLKLFPVSTYAVPGPPETRPVAPSRASSGYSPPQMTVAERVSELERQSKYSAYQDGRRQSRDPGLKAQQKSALLSFYERQQQKENKQSWRSEPQLASNQPPPPPQVRPPSSSRRASSASDYADWRDRDLPDPSPEAPATPEQPMLPSPLQVPHNARFSPNSALDGPVIVGSAISVDDWVPERPPKNAKLLRNVFPDLYHQHDRLPSPELPLPSPPTVLEDEVFNDEPFPPPPTDIAEWKYEQEVPERLEKPNNLAPSPLAENVAKPMPIRSSVIKPADSTLEKSHCFGPIREHPVMRPTELPLNSANALPISHNQFKKSYSNFNEKLFRNSFRSTNEGPHHALTHDIRASMRHYRSNVGMQSKMASPQKPMMSAQKMLFRSTTVEETPSPKRPINPFLRSTSLRQNETSRNSMPAAPQSPQYPCDRIQRARYSCGPAVFNGELIDKHKEAVGHYRPECDKSKSVVSKIEQLQQILKGNAEAKKCDSFYASVSSPSAQHGALSKKTTHPGPPPLYPKQSAAAQVPPKQDSTAVSPNRGNENVCYAPARAKLPDPSVGSYKLIHPKDEPPPPARPALPDLLLPTAAPALARPAFDYAERRSCEQHLSLPLDYAKQCSLSPEPEPEPEPAAEPGPVAEPAESAAEAAAPPEEPPEELALPEATRWQETVPAQAEFAHARRRLVRALPADHPLRRLASLSQDQRSPIDFIRDFFAEAPSTEETSQRTADPTPAPETTHEDLCPSAESEVLEQLKKEVVRASERVVSSLEAAGAAAAAAAAANDALGAAVRARLAAPLAGRFASHHTEVLHISALMAALSARLARTYDECERHRPQGKQMEELRCKRERLEEQLVEARSLKENIDARAATLAAKIGGELDAASFRDYRLFMAVKPRLVIRARHLQYRLDYERERLKALQQSLPDR